jgi:hypothetical protein
LKGIAYLAGVYQPHFYKVMNKPHMQAIELYIAAYNNFDIAGMLDNLHREVRFENVSNGQVNLTTEGIEAFKQQAEQAATFFRTREQRITHVHTEADTVVVDIAYHAILAIDLPNGLKAGDALHLKGKSTFVFADGKIIRIKDES